MDKKIYIVHYARIYKPHPNGFLIRQKMFHDLRKAQNFKNRQEEGTGFKASIVTLILSKDGIESIVS